MDEVKKYTVRVRTMFFAGVMLAMVGWGLYTMEHEVAGVAMMIAGMTAVVLSFLLLKFLVTVDLRRR